ncbi:MAG TPA: hypothetical protein VFG05_01350 [Methylocella sp.]|nr:hypothetical protein [Methylocella sp.]
MKRWLAGCLWLIAVTAASAYVSVSLKSRPPANASMQNSSGGLERKKVEPVNVPIISNGNVEGYIVVQIVYLADSTILRNLPFPLDDFLRAEAFQLLYSSDVDFDHIEKYDVRGLVENLIGRINKRFGRDIVKEILITELNYVSKKEISQ